MRFTNFGLVLPLLLATVTPSLEAQEQSSESEVSLLQTVGILDESGQSLAENGSRQEGHDPAGHLLLKGRRDRTRVGAYEQVGQGDYVLNVSLTKQDKPVALTLEADRLLQQGIEQLTSSQFREALTSWQEALEVYQAIGDQAGEGQALGNLGLAYMNLSQYQRAIDLFEKSLDITREIGDQAGEGRVLGNLGVAYLSLSQYQRAIDLFEQRLKFAHELGDRAGEGRALGNLGSAYLGLGQDQQAIDLYSNG